MPEPARFAYLILAHQRPAQVEDLTARLLELSPACRVLVHYDGEDVPWNGGAPGGALPARVGLVERTRILWGDWTMVEVSLRMVRRARRELDADWCVILSGDARPVVDLATWEATTAASGADGIVPGRALERRPAFGRAPTADDLNLVRYSYRWRPLPAPAHPAGRAALGGLRRLSRYTQPLFKIEYAARRDRWFLGTPRRGAPARGWSYAAGPQWVALGPRAADAVLDVDDGVVEWFRHTWIPDQGFFQTVLANVPGLDIRREPVVYVVPSRLSRQRSNWMALRTGDLEGLWASGAPLARKFDDDVDPAVAALVDAAVERSRSTAPGPGGGGPRPPSGPRTGRVAS